MVLAQSGTETLASNQASNAVATVFRTQAHELLLAKQADLRAANDLKLAVQDAVARQVAFVKLNQDQRNKLASEVSTARAKASALTAARQAAALAAQAARRRGGGGRAGTGGGRKPGRRPGGLGPGAVLVVRVGRLDHPGRRRRQLGADPAGQALPVGRGRP